MFAHRKAFINKEKEEINSILLQVINFELDHYLSRCRKIFIKSLYISRVFDLLHLYANVHATSGIDGNTFKYFFYRKLYSQNHRPGVQGAPASSNDFSNCFKSVLISALS